jgi:prepilin-type N-terminal cleavage/methylation domain-containing protein
MNMMKRAFTLTELLVSLAIIGTIAVLAVPPLMSDIHTKVYLNLIKNMSVTIEQLAADQMLNKRSHNLADTDFGSVDSLLSSKHFSIVKKDTNLLTSDYKNFNNVSVSIDGINGQSLLLKNGVIFTYIPIANGAISVGTFIMDANGNDGPNVVGKDLFIFDITKKGKIIASPDNDFNSKTSEEKLTDCAGGNGRACYGYVVENGWKYPN